MCVGGPTEDFLDDNAAQIAARLRRAAGHALSPMAAQAYDAARLVFDRVKQRGRAELSILAGARLAAGACGPAVIDGAGQMRRQPILLRVDTDELVPHEW
jgi:hypothetical protein